MKIGSLLLMSLKQAHLLKYLKDYYNFTTKTKRVSMNEEEVQPLFTILEFLILCKKSVDSLILPTEEDEGITDPQQLKAEREKIIKELEAEAIAWEVKIPKEGINEKNFYLIKGLVKKSIIDKVMSISTEEEAFEELPKIRGE